MKGALVCLLLAIGAGVNAWLWWSPAPTHQTLPIFTPVSLEMERAMRKGPGRGGDEATKLAQALLVESNLDPALAPDVKELAALRLHLLDRRNQRHALNTRLMQVGVEVGSQLTEDQWAVVTMQRDALRRDGDEEVFERLLKKLSSPRIQSRGSSKRGQRVA